MHKDLRLQFGRTSMRIGDVSQVRQRKESKENKQEPSGSKCVPLIGSIFYLECNEKSNSKDSVWSDALNLKYWSCDQIFQIYQIFF